MCVCGRGDEKKRVKERIEESIGFLGFETTEFEI